MYNNQEKELKIVAFGEKKIGMGEQGPIIFYNKFIKPFGKNN